MSRKRKPVLQLGGNSSKLHKYGYSKDFCIKEDKGKGNLSSLVGSYSDSDGEVSPDEGTAQPISEADITIDGKQPTGNHVDAHAESESKNPQGDGKSQDMDDELKNFLSEIEAIPMPDDGGDVAVSNSGMPQNPPGSDEEKSPVPQSTSLDKDEGSPKCEEIQDNTNTEVSSLSSSKATTKSRYSMFVQGESEFTKKCSPSPEAKISDTKVEKTERSSDIKIPEEPTTHWQLVQDETSQYFYYWNTLTNEVTWDIPTEYTQYLLLHREYTDKIAKLPPEVQKAHKDKHSRESEAALHLQLTEGHQESAGSSKTSDSTRARTEPAESSGQHTVPEKKHKKEKKRRRHKHRHSDSDGDLSDGGTGGNSRGSPAVMEYGPQLPQLKQVNTKPVVKQASSGPSGSTQLMSIVPYLSDDDDADAEQPESNNTKVQQQAAAFNSKEAASVKSGRSPSPHEPGVNDDQKVSTIGDMAPKEDRTPSKKEETKIDMFAEDSVPNIKTNTVLETVPKDLSVKNEHASKVKVPSLHDDTVKNEEAMSSKAASTSESLHMVSNDNSLSEKLSGKDKDVPKTLELETEDTKAEILDASKLVNIVGYSSGDEEAAKLKGEVQLDLRLKECEQTGKMSLLPASASKKRKKDKRKHKYEEREEEEKAEAMEGVLANIVKGHLGKDMVARVTDTLDQEISDIVIQTVCKTKTNSLASMADVLEHRDEEISVAGKDSLKDPDVRKGAKEIKKGSGETVAEQIDKSVHSLADKRMAKEVAEDDDDDIDFEDLDDIDRALEVALEKKKIELAKYEEGERKQQITADSLNNKDKLVAEDPITTDRNEVSNEEEEKMKEEVKDAAELALNKLEFLDISADSLTRLQVLLIELQTRLQDWTAGGLSTSYFQEQLAVAQGLLEHYELSAVPNGWACQWDRGNNRYYYRNLTTNRIQWDYPDDDKARDIVPETEAASEKVEQAVEEKSSKNSSRGERTRDKPGKEVEDDGRKKGSRSSRRRKRDDRDKERGSKYKRRDSSNSSHHYRKKRRRKRDHSSSSSSSSEAGADTTSSKKQHRHHHKISSKKKKKRRSRSSRSPSVQVVDASDQERTSWDKKNGDNVLADVTVIEASPAGSSVEHSPAPDNEAQTSTTPVVSQAAPLTTFNEKSLPESSENLADVASLSSIATDKATPKEMMDNSGGTNSNKDDENHEEEEIEAAPEKEKGEIVKAAVIYKPPQIVMPSQPAASVQQPEPFMAASQALSSQEVAAAPEDSKASEEGSVKEHAAEPEEDPDKQSKKKKKDKKLATGSSLLMKKKHMSSMVQKWQKVKKEVEKEDRAKEMRQAAIRKKIEELK